MAGSNINDGRFAFLTKVSVQSSGLLSSLLEVHLSDGLFLCELSISIDFPLDVRFRCFSLAKGVIPMDALSCGTFPQLFLLRLRDRF